MVGRRGPVTTAPRRGFQKAAPWGSFSIASATVPPGSDGDIRNEIIGYAGALPTLFGDVNGDGVVDINDYTAARRLIGTRL